MSSYISFVLAVILPMIALAAEYSVGQKVFWRTGAEAKIGSTVIDIQTIPFPATILHVNGDWLWLDRAWVRKRDVMTTPEALDYFTEQIRINPANAAGWHGRGSVWVEKGELEIAIKDFSEAIRLDPNDASVFYNRGICWQKKGVLDSALIDYSEAIRLNPKDPSAYINRGNAQGNKGNIDAALIDYKEALRLDPSNSAAYNYIAWTHATHVDQQFRDGQKAVEFATKACELTAWKSPVSLDTLAAAEAETRNFPEAIRWQKLAIELSPPSKKPAMKERLNVYLAGQPFRDPTSK